MIGDSGVITGWLGICGRGFYDAFVGHATVKQAYDRWNDGQFLRDDLRKGFTFGEVTWKEFYGKVGSISFIGENDAYLIPVGVSFTFNLGAGALQRSTLRRKVNRGEHQAVPAELMKWVWAAGKRLPGLVRRRQAEVVAYASEPSAGMKIENDSVREARTG